jgi:hypothetical protein
VSARFRLLAILAVWLFPAALALDLIGCNDGSTGCCRICPECACGDSCISCATRCTLPKGCACSSTTQLSQAALRTSISDLKSISPDAARD